MNAFIVAQQRTGSTLLYEFIDSHPGLFCADELFIMRGAVDYRFRMLKVYNWYKKTSGWTVKQYLNWVFGLSQHSCIKVLYHQVDYFNMIDIVLNTPVIHLTRKNYFHRIVSFFKTIGEIDRKRPQDYIDDIEAAIKRDKMWGDVLFKCPKYLKLSFEDLVGRHEQVRDTYYTFCREDTGRQICDFFGVPYFEMFTATPKALSKKNYWEYIPEKHREVLKKMLEANFPEEVWK